MANPLQNLDGAGAIADFRFPDVPQLSPLVRTHGLMQGIELFDRQVMEWRNNVERALNERLSNSGTVSTGELG